MQKIIFSVNKQSVTWLKCEPYLSSEVSRNSTSLAVENVPLEVLQGVQVKCQCKKTKQGKIFLKTEGEDVLDTSPV